MKTLTTSLFLVFTFFVSAQGQNCLHSHAAGEHCALTPVYEDMNTYVPPIQLPTQGLVTSSSTATFEVSYNGFTAPAQNAFQFAVDIWASLLTSDVPIKIDATFASLGEGTLGSAGPREVFQNFTGATEANVYYPSALADKLRGVDNEPGFPDIVSNFNNTTDWYFGTDGNTPSGQFDFVSVVLHELGHGLGIVGSAQVDGNVGAYGFGLPPVEIIYDVFVENGGGSAILSFPNNSTALASQLTSDALFWDGPNALAANQGQRPRMFAPSPFQGGSSYSHLNEGTYLPGNPNSLMTPQIGQAEAIHSPGPILLGMMQDMGWMLDTSTNDNLICDCAGTQHTLGVLDWLGDGYSDDGSFAWEDQPVDFNCATWGYDCGDFADAPTDDPFNVCNGDLPPNNGCGGGCVPVSLSATDGGCQEDENGVLLPVITILFQIEGDCIVEDLCWGINGATPECSNLPDNNFTIGDGGDINLINSAENAIYEIYFTTADGQSSSTFFTTGNCSEELSGCTDPNAVNYNPAATTDDGSCVYGTDICDCLGTVHTVGVLDWIGDGYADDGSFEWESQPVDFNCATWGYDCGDVANSPSDDPHGVCAGNLPPQNGCGAVLSTDNFSALDVSIYPNPFTESLTIDLGNLNDSRVVIMDLQGRIITEKEMNGINTLETSSLISGMYQVLILHEKGQLAKSIIKY